jgi:hypothetical protein
MTSRPSGSTFPVWVLALVLAVASRVEAQSCSSDSALAAEMLSPGFPSVGPMGPGLGYGNYATGGTEMGLASWATGAYETGFGWNGGMTYNALGDFAGSLGSGYGLGNSQQVGEGYQAPLALRPNSEGFTSVPGGSRSTGKVRRKPRPTATTRGGDRRERARFPGVTNPQSAARIVSRPARPGAASAGR